MTKYDSLQLFEKKKVRTIWDDEQENGISQLLMLLLF